MIVKPLHRTDLTPNSGTVQWLFCSFGAINIKRGLVWFDITDVAFSYSNCVNLDITTMIALVSSLTNGGCGYLFKVLVTSIFSVFYVCLFCFPCCYQSPVCRTCCKNKLFPWTTKGLHLSSYSDNHILTESNPIWNKQIKYDNKPNKYGIVEKQKKLLVCTVDP